MTTTSTTDGQIADALNVGADGTATLEAAVMLLADSGCWLDREDFTSQFRPGRPNAAASSFLSGIIREPLAGQRAPCPVPPDTQAVVSSPRRALEGILLAAAASDEAWGSRTAMNLPALTTTPRQMAAALDRVAGPGASALIDWTADPAIAAIVRSWPARVETPRARSLGLEPDESFEAIIRAYIAGGDGAAAPGG